jgi:ankyrin repeat protein
METEDNALLKAVIDGDFKKVKDAIRQGCDVNAKTENGSTALMLATSFGYIAIINFLKENGAE